MYFLFIIFFLLKGLKSRSHIFTGECYKVCIVFQMIKDMKQQFSGLLHEIGFLDSSHPKASAANHNSGMSVRQNKLSFHGQHLFFNSQFRFAFAHCWFFVL